MQKEAKKIRKQLKTIHIEAEADGVTIVVNAEQEIISITIREDVPREAIADRMKDAMNRAMKKAQVVASEKMQSVMGAMGMPTEAGMKSMGQ